MMAILRFSASFRWLRRRGRGFAGMRWRRRARLGVRTGLAFRARRSRWLRRRALFPLTAFLQSRGARACPPVALRGLEGPSRDLVAQLVTVRSGSRRWRSRTTRAARIELARARVAIASGTEAAGRASSRLVARTVRPGPV